ncbi:hypothetical protein O181_076880 [Austropuccinia psidii MF-1]|uniref:Integrase catalytic domain-containing protein n=1 Tax=Austropuccinia psidii MF-1 TaxID=1389203 RepID=A0A9Q3F9N5_9BASI|nr:hypothetical protein [Austropuccinia psidii MF-1]
MRRFTATTGFKIRAIRMDNGSEFKNNILSSFLLAQGITHETSIPYKHHQNGRVERTNRSIIEIAQTSLLSAGIPKRLWPFAFKHAAFIFNRVIHANSTKTPYEIVRSLKPTLVLLRVFGAKSYIFNPLHRKDLGPRGIVGYHMGVAPDSKGWIFWVPDKGDFFMKSASVKFDEEVSFPSGHVSSIQVSDIFDNSMILELEKQDALVSSLNTVSDSSNITPMTFKDVMISPQKDNWISAIDDELKSMQEEDVFEIINLKDALQNKKASDILSTRWVFTQKKAPLRYKARLVARGFKQTKGVNFEETFAPTPTFNALRLLFSILIANKWVIRTFDVKVAFLHSLIDMPVFVWPPRGMDIPPGKVLKFNKALYGTKQAARCLWRHLTTILIDIGFEPNKEDLSTYTYLSASGTALLCIHVDDGALTASLPQLLERIVAAISSKLKIKWDETMTGLGSRPDITYAVNYLARFSLGTTPAHWEALEHLIAYLRMTKKTGILIRDSGSTLAFECYVDANCGGEGNRSTHGFLLLHNNNPISWQSKQQATIASSACQAEYMAMSFAAREYLIALNIACQKQTRHLIREFNLVNEYIAKGKISISWISTHDQMADILTKPLRPLKVTHFLSLLNSTKLNVPSRGGECYDSTKNQKKFLEHSKT